MTKNEAISFLQSMQLVVKVRYGSNYGCERMLKVICADENPWGPDTPGGPEDTKQKFEEAIKVLTE